MVWVRLEVVVGKVGRPGCVIIDFLNLVRLEQHKGVLRLGLKHLPVVLHHFLAKNDVSVLAIVDSVSDSLAVCLANISAFQKWYKTISIVLNMPSSTESCLCTRFVGCRNIFSINLLVHLTIHQSVTLVLHDRFLLVRWIQFPLVGST